MNAEHLIDEVVNEGTKPSEALRALVEVDRHAVDDLELYIQNDRQLYKSLHNDFAKNLITKVARGQYNKDLAAKLMLYLVDRAAQQYTKAFDARSRGGSSFGIFDKPTRMEVAKSLVDDFEEEAKSGRYEALLPKKYQGTLTYPLTKL